MPSDQLRAACHFCFRITAPRYNSSTSSASRIDGLPTGLSRWFASSTDLPLFLLPSESSALPKSEVSALLVAAKHGKGHSDKASDTSLTGTLFQTSVQTIFGSSAFNTRGTSPLHHQRPLAPDVVRAGSSTMNLVPTGRRSSGSSASFRSSTSSVTSSMHMSPSQPSSSTKHPHNPAANWPPVFYFKNLVDLPFAFPDADRGHAFGGSV